MNFLYTQHKKQCLENPKSSKDGLTSKFEKSNVYIQLIHVLQIQNLHKKANLTKKKWVEIKIH